MARPSQAELELATIAHRLWCERMLRDGWTPGPVFDPRVRRHDALIPFERLPAEDRRSTVLDVMSSDLIDDLGRMPAYARGESAELTASEMHVGLEIGFDGDRSARGVVESWEEDPGWPGCLRSITVRWDSGEISAHLVIEHELRRLR